MMSSQIKIYADGTRIPETVVTGFVVEVPAKEIQVNRRTSNNLEVYTVEMLAILAALLWVVSPSVTLQLSVCGDTLMMGLFYKDTVGHMDVTDPAGGNRGLAKRASFTNASNVVKLLAPVHSNIFFQEKLMLNGMDIKIRITKIKNKKVSVSPPAVRVGHAQALLTTTAKYPIDRVCVKNFSIPAGSRFCNQENLFLGTLPKSVVLAMVDNDEFVGSFNKNPFAFKHYDLEFLDIYVDGQQHPAKPFQPEYEQGSTVREFYQLA